MSYKIVPHNQRIDIPETIGVCPYCGAKLSVQLDTWTQLDDGLWGAMEDETPHVDCDREPFMGEKGEWDKWWASHCKMPYVYLLPIEVKVAKWINENFRFDMEVSV